MNKKLSTSIILVIIGVLCIIFKQELVKYLISGMGILTIVSGVIDISKNKTTNGIIQILIGILMISFSWLILEVCLLLIGISLLAYAIRKLSFAIKLTEHVDSTYKKVQLVAFPLLTVILGILLIISRWAFVNTLFIIIGIILILNGLSIAINKES